MSGPQYNEDDEKEGMEQDGKTRITLRVSEKFVLPIGHSTTI